MITNGQRKLFFAFVGVIGRDPAYAILRAVTKGRIESLKDKALSQPTFSIVLSELFVDHPNILSKKHQATRGTAPFIKRGGDTVRMIDGDLKAGINALKSGLNLSDHKYRAICQTEIGLDAPLSYDNGLKVLAALTKQFKQRRSK